MLFSVRMVPGERYCDMYRRIEEARNRIVRVTPTDLTSNQQLDEISLFSALHAMPQDDPLHRQLVGQKDVTLRDAYLSFMRTDRDASVALDATVHVAIPFAGNHADRKEHHPHIEAETRVLKNMVFLDSAPKTPSTAPLMGMAQYEVEVSSSADHETERD